MKKSFYVVFLWFLSIYFFVNSLLYFSLFKPLVGLPNNFSFSLDSSFIIDTESLYFLYMVLFVTSLVLLYSELYMEHYNNKKFFFLTLSFLGSMIILSLSNSLTLLMIGWDGLGLSSLFLIMFYPGKIPLFNSLMTFFYNRLGDCLMIMVLCLLINTSNLSLTVIGGIDSFMILVFLVVCSFTKSAQFPLSSWLPAAMSAPTPISAMVHSSTLVTAGIYIIYKFSSFLVFNGMMTLILAVSSLTFIIGGFLGVLEMDLKKIVAFSTMSQISMIILFCSTSELVLTVSHMIFHALFKTLLFCSCGVAFLSMFSDQFMKSFSMYKHSISLVLTLFVSIYCMTGLPFSSSFFSKDLFIELTCSSMNSFIFLCIILGSSFTILYSSKILSVINSSYYSKSAPHINKNSLFLFLLFFCLMNILFPYIIEFFLLPSSCPVVSTQDLIWILTVLVASMFFLINLPFSTSVFSSEILFSKFFMFGMMSKIFSMDSPSMHFNDHLMFKPYTFVNLKKKLIVNLKSVNLFFMFLGIYFLFFV